MAGMFLSLKETAQQLGTTEDQVKQLVQEGRLREFRDGTNLLFKLDEVNSLLSGGAEMAAEDAALDGEAFDGMELEEISAEEQSGEVFEEVEEAEPMLDEDLFRLDEEDAPALEPMGEVESTSELGLASEETAADETAGGEDELLFLADDEQPVAADTADGSSDDFADSLSDSIEEEISLAGESGVLAAGSDITDMDTAITGEDGVNVLGESSTDFGVTDDSMAETAIGPAGSSAEASLEEIEDDVSLDSFGSGSGLLDLSLQADDTSLGGILDEIYTSEGGEGEGESSDAEPVGIGGEEASFDELTAESDHAGGAEEEMPMPEPVAMMPAGVGAIYGEAAPDAQSNILGMLLFLPMLALLYTAIVAVSGLRGVTPSILSSIQGMIWYILGGAIVVSLIVVAASFMAGRERSAAPARSRKEKKTKAEKPSKKAKAEKPAKAEKSAKEKKGFFGKKK
jgi:excisionase family DNA binding protein